MHSSVLSILNENTLNLSKLTELNMKVSVVLCLKTEIEQLKVLYEMLACLFKDVFLIPSDYSKISNKWYPIWKGFPPLFPNQTCKTGLLSDIYYLSLFSIAL